MGGRRRGGGILDETLLLKKLLCSGLLFHARGGVVEGGLGLSFLEDPKPVGATLPFPPFGRGGTTLEPRFTVIRVVEVFKVVALSRAVRPIKIVVDIRKGVHLRVEQFDELSVGQSVGPGLASEGEHGRYQVVENLVREHVTSSVAVALLHLGRP